VQVLLDASSLQITQAIISAVKDGLGQEGRGRAPENFLVTRYILGFSLVTVIQSATTFGYLSFWCANEK